jgi:hypothetical protein
MNLIFIGCNYESPCINIYFCMPYMTTMHTFVVYTSIKSAEYSTGLFRLS